MKIYVCGILEGKDNFAITHMAFKTEKRALQHQMVCDRPIKCNDITQIVFVDE